MLLLAGTILGLSSCARQPSNLKTATKPKEYPVLVESNPNQRQNIKDAQAKIQSILQAHGKDTNNSSAPRSPN